jgi:hypothetical protein
MFYTGPEGVTEMKNWKTSLLGVIGGLFMLFGPRLSGDATAPPVTMGNVGAAAAIAVLGILAKDHDATGGTRNTGPLSGATGTPLPPPPVTGAFSQAPPDGPAKL